MNIGVFGGSFDPPHMGHKKLLVNFKKSLSLDKIIVIPTYRPPHKRLKGEVSPKNRLNMAKLAFSDMAKVIVSDIEIKRKGLSYTADTLQYLKNENPNDKIFLLIGSDMLYTIDSWHNPEKIFLNAAIVAAPREINETDKMQLKKEELKQKYKCDIIILDIPPYPISSTEVREKIINNNIKKSDLPKKVKDYIDNKELYIKQIKHISENKLEYYKNILKEKLTNKRLEHSLGVMQSAAELAEKYGADIYKAELAGLLHDITKELTLKEHIELCEKYKIKIPAEEKEISKLYHSKTGAYYIKNELNIKDKEIISAIFYHTSAKKDMTLFEKIIYIADYIEPKRDYHGVIALRKLAFTDLDKCYLNCLSFTVNDLVNRKRVIAINTIEAYNNSIKIYEKSNEKRKSK